MRELGYALNTALTPPPALVEFAAVRLASPGLVAKATARGLSPRTAELCCAVLTRVIVSLDDAGKMRRGTYGRAKLLETALEACRPPVSDALRVAMVACPVDGRAVLRLWREVCEPYERGAMLDLLAPSERYEILQES